MTWLVSKEEGCVLSDSGVATPPEELSGIGNLRKALSESFAKDLGSHYCSYAGMSAFRTLFHYLIRKKSERLRLASQIARDWERFVRTSFKGRVEALRAQYTSMPLVGATTGEDLGGVVDSCFSEAIEVVKREIAESLLEPGETFLKVVKGAAPE